MIVYKDGVIKNIVYEEGVEVWLPLPSFFRQEERERNRRQDETYEMGKQGFAVSSNDDDRRR